MVSAKQVPISALFLGEGFFSGLPINRADPSIYFLNVGPKQSLQRYFLVRVFSPGFQSIGQTLPYIS